MKYIFLIGVFFSMSLFAGCGGKPSVVGKYHYCCNPKMAYLEFTKDGRIVFYNTGVKPKRGTYTVDESKSPMQMDITLTDEVGSTEKKTYTLASVYKFDNPNLLKIKLANFSETAEGEKLMSIRPNGDFVGIQNGYRIFRCERVSSIPDEVQKETSSP